MKEMFLTISCDVVPVVIDLSKSTKEQSNSFSTKVTQFICNPENFKKSIEEFKNGEFREYTSALHTAVSTPIEIKNFLKIVATICQCEVEITEVLYRECVNEFWVIAKEYNMEDCEKFYDFVFENWGDIVSNSVILFIGENQLDRKQMPTDIRRVISFK